LHDSLPTDLARIAHYSSQFSRLHLKITGTFSQKRSRQAIQRAAGIRLPAGEPQSVSQSPAMGL
jgi:hypothetical protein